jgi:ACS family hexuronate transporter-like MFS transporter
LLALALISAIVFAYSAWAANVLTLPSDIFPSGVIATVVSASGMAAGVGGILTTFLAGKIIDRYSYDPVFWGLGTLPLLALACCLLAGRRAKESPSIANI